MNHSDRTDNNTRNMTTMMDCISKASYHARDASNVAPVQILDGPKKLAVISVAKSLSTFDQEEEERRHSKRSKPRRQSGQETEGVTEDDFKKQMHAFLPREDSLTMLQHKTTDAIPMIVPFEQEEEEVAVMDDSQKSAGSGQSLPRRKPRRLSGEAVADETRPVLVREDSLQLMKDKLAAAMDASGNSAESEDTVPLNIPIDFPIGDDKDKDSNLDKKPAARKMVPRRSQSVQPTSTTASAAPTKSVPRRTRSQKQKGVVRQNSMGPPCA